MECLSLCHIEEASQRGKQQQCRHHLGGWVAGDGPGIGGNKTAGVFLPIIGERFLGWTVPLWAILSFSHLSPSSSRATWIVSTAGRPSSRTFAPPLEHVLPGIGVRRIYFVTSPAHQIRYFSRVDTVSVSPWTHPRNLSVPVTVDTWMNRNNVAAGGQAKGEEIEAVKGTIREKKGKQAMNNI